MLVILLITMVPIHYRCSTLSGLLLIVLLRWNYKCTTYLNWIKYVKCMLDFNPYSYQHVLTVVLQTPRMLSLWGHISCKMIKLQCSRNEDDGHWKAIEKRCGCFNCDQTNLFIPIKFPSHEFSHCQAPSQVSKCFCFYCVVIPCILTAHWSKALFSQLTTAWALKWSSKGLVFSSSISPLAGLGYWLY